jgi:energy-coupling factor transporter ATP-binding protein EcfA2
MSLLELRRVSKSRSRGSRRIEVLREVSLELDAGEFVAVWGQRHSGRSTLLRVAAGIDLPDRGEVHFDGTELGTRGTTELGRGVGYCHIRVGVPTGRPVTDTVRAGLLARGVAAPTAYSSAHKALERVGIERSGELLMADLDGAEAVRVAIACGLVLGPRVLMIDEPTKGVDVRERDKILLLVRSLANEGIAVLISDGDGSALSDADRSLTLADGELRGKATPELGSLLQLHHAAGKSTAA